MRELQLVGDIPLDVDADCSSYQYRIFYIESDGRASLGNAASRNCMILQDDPAAAGRAGAFRMIGISKCVYGGTVNPGDEIISDATGRGVARASTTGVWVVGIALVHGLTGHTGSIVLLQYHI